MEFRTRVEIQKPGFEIAPFEEMLFVGSCFADAIGRRFVENKFRATVNPYGVMYNPASVLHTVERFVAEKKAKTTSARTCKSVSPTCTSPSVHAGGVLAADGQNTDSWPRVVFITLGTNHVYRLKETGEIVDNCQKRPAALFQEEQLTVDECADYLRRTVDLLVSCRPDTHIVCTVSPIRYRKYGYHESQLSKATLLLAVEKLPVSYFPAYEIVMDELRDYRFYAADMLHPSEQAVDYIWQQLVEHYLSSAARQFLHEWEPLRLALSHRPLHPDSEEYRAFAEKTRQQLNLFRLKYPLCDFLSPFNSL